MWHVDATHDAGGAGQTPQEQWPCEDWGPPQSVFPVCQACPPSWTEALAARPPDPRRGEGARGRPGSSRS